MTLMWADLTASPKEWDQAQSRDSQMRQPVWLCGFGLLSFRFLSCMSHLQVPRDELFREGSVWM